MSVSNQNVIFDELRAKSKFFYLTILGLGVFSSAFNMLFLIFLNRFVVERNEAMPFYIAFIFFGLVLLSFGINALFQSILIHRTNNALFDIESNLLNRLIKAPLVDFERFGNERIYSITGDVRTLMQFPAQFIEVLNASIIIICGVIYLFLISLSAGFSVFILCLVLYLFYYLRNKGLMIQLDQLREKHNEYFKVLNDLLMGYKQIKMSRKRAVSIENEHLIQNLRARKDLMVDTSKKFMFNELFGNHSWYLLIGTIIFIVARLFSLPEGDQARFLITVIFLIGPIVITIGAIDGFSRSKIAYQRIKNFNQQLGHEREGTFEVPRMVPLSDELLLKVEHITYNYFDNSIPDQFEFGPVSLTIPQNTITFIVGGNGSGKSTFLKLITGLYQPKTGLLNFNIRYADDTATDDPKEAISVIFADNLLFSEDYDHHDLTKTNKRFMDLLVKMQLDQVVRFDEAGKLDLKKDLSTGQKKRLMLILLILEDKPVIIFDEWAAEQDPIFKRYFYEELLMSFIDQGKTVIAVTHDKNYFHLADCLVEFEFGKINTVKSKTKLINTLRNNG